MRRLALVAFALALGAVAVHAQGVPTDPDYTPLALTCSPDDAQAGYDAVWPLDQAFQDDVGLILDVPDSAKPPIIADQQRIRRQIQALRLADCGAWLQFYEDHYMNDDIEAHLAALRGDYNFALTLLGRAQPELIRVLMELDALRQVAGIPEP